MKYTVTHTVKFEFYYDVDAEDEDDALDKARAIVGMEWDGNELDIADDYEVASSRWNAEETIDV